MIGLGIFFVCLFLLIILLELWLMIRKFDDNELIIVDNTKSDQIKLLTTIVGIITLVFISKKIKNSVKRK